MIHRDWTVMSCGKHCDTCPEDVSTAPTSLDLYETGLGGGSRYAPKYKKLAKSCHKLVFHSS